MKQLARYGTLAVTLLFIAISFFLSNCNKKTNGNDLAENGTNGPTYGFYSSCGDPLNGTTVLQVIRNDHDPVDDKITLIQYHYARALRQVAKNPTHLCYMVNAMLGDVNDAGVSVLELANGNAAFAAAVNAELRASVNATSSENIYPRGIAGESGIDALRGDANWDANAFLRSKMLYGTEQYNPVVHFVKKPTSCEVSGPVTVLIAQDVDGCDDVAGWHGDDEVVMSEGDVRSSNEIVIFVGPGEVYASPVTAPVVEVEGYGPTVMDRAPFDINSTSRQIMAGHAFESSTTIEVVGATRFFTTSPLAGAGFITWPTVGVSQSAVAASAISTASLPVWVTPQSMSASIGVNYFFWEYDWWASAKSIPNVCAPSVAVAAKRKFSFEFYFSDCGTLSSLYPSIGSTRTLTGFMPSGALKGTFTFTRMN